jgi:hypothetical protein
MPVMWTAMPEASIHKNSDLLSAKNKIGLSRQRNPAPPAGDAMCPKQADKPLFSACVTRASH